MSAPTATSVPITGTTDEMFETAANCAFALDVSSMTAFAAAAAEHVVAVVAVLRRTAECRRTTEPLRAERRQPRGVAALVVGGGVQEAVGSFDETVQTVFQCRR